MLSFISHIDIPKVTAQILNFQTAQLGSALILSCNFDGVPIPTIQWLHNGTVLTNMEDTVTITGDSNSTLQLSNLNRNGGGVYSCEAENDLGKSTLEFQIEIQSESV